MYGLQQDRPVNPVFGSQGAGSGSSSMRLLSNNQQRGNRKCEKDGNFNFLGQEDDVLTGDENRNQLRSRVQSSQGRDPHFGSGALSPLSRLPGWSPLEPLPEIEIGEEGCGRVPPEGAEGKMEEETGRGREEEKEGKVVEEEEDGDEGEERDEGDEWGDSESEFEFSYRSSGSSSSLSTESGEGAGAGAGGFSSIWDRICVGGPRAEEEPAGGTATPVYLVHGRAGDGEGEGEAGTGTESGCKSVGGEASSDSDTDLCSDLPELQEAIWTLRDREKFKAREMEKHQVQLTMYRRLALIRWVRTLQSRVQEQQNRLQSSFDIILTHRKELLRLGAATASQS
ncbi:hypothetical protein AAFF_G00196410 [Aldrovandia affinis]|uniref:CA216 protein n=1 Tax=Aldrovandia affinis TaxID=143900 RepID=A0AAD7W684_9TELE|nr:hypothetical protein AAFF_G00196410 [Aldrovandia affinis]